MCRSILAAIVTVASCGAAVSDISKYMGNPGVAQVSGVTVIRSREAAIALDNSSGRVVALIDQHARLNLDSPTNNAGLFSIGLSRPRTGEHRVIPAPAFRQVKLETHSTAGSAEVTVHFSDAQDAKLTVACRFAVQFDDPLISATVQVDNHSDWAIPFVDFPSLILNPKIGERGEDDVLLLPGMGGEMFLNPSALPVHIPPENKTLQYPGMASYQMTAFFDDAAGLYLATYDTAGNVKNYRAFMTDEGLNLTPRHQGPEVLGAGFRTDYPTVIAATRGPWYNAADRYKQWAVKQFWCRTKLADRADVPEWLKSGPPFLLAYSPAPQLHAPSRANDIDGLIDAIDLYRRASGAKDVMYTSGGWERQGVWLGPYYFPTQPPEAWWKTFCEKAGKRNIHVSLMTSGYKWTIQQNHPDGAPAFNFTEDFERRKGMAITNADGTPYFRGTPDAMGFMGGTRSRICRGTKEGQDLMAGVFARLAGMGVAMSSFDQDIGGGEPFACYNPTHAHPPGYGKWMWETYRDLLIRILQEARASVPQFVLYQEDENELTIPWQATSWSRDYHILDHQHPNAWGVPVYRYMYHEYASSIGAAMFHGSGANPAPETRAYAMARALALGMHQGEFAEEILLNAQGQPASMPSRAYFGFSHALADYSQFLVLGRMLRPVELKASQTRLPFRRRAQKTNQITDYPIDLPAVVQGVYQAPDGRVGVILANATDSQQDATVHLPEPYPGKAHVVREFRKGVEAGKHPLGPITLSMAALEAVFLELD